jgi:hypothetical protein
LRSLAGVGLLSCATGSGKALPPFSDALMKPPAFLK